MFFPHCRLTETAILHAKCLFKEKKKMAIKGLLLSKCYTHRLLRFKQSKI